MMVFMSCGQAVKMRRMASPSSGEAEAEAILRGWLAGCPHTLKGH